MKLLSSMGKLARKRKVVMAFLVMTSMRRNPFIFVTKLATKTLVLMDLLASKTSGKTATKTLVLMHQLARNTHADPGGSTTVSIKTGPT